MGFVAGCCRLKPYFHIFIFFIDIYCFYLQQPATSIKNEQYHRRRKNDVHLSRCPVWMALGSVMLWHQLCISELKNQSVFTGHPLRVPALFIATIVATAKGADMKRRRNRE